MKFKILKISALIILMAGFFGISLSQAEEVKQAQNSPLQVVNQLFEGTHYYQLHPDKTSVSDIENFMNANFDFETFYSTILKGYWNQWSANQKEIFAEHFKPSFLRTIEGAFKYQLNSKHVEKMATKELPIADHKAVVSYSFKVDNDIHEGKIYLTDNNGQWKMYDIECEGASLSVNYKAQLDWVLAHQNFDSLIARFDKPVSVARNGGSQF